MNSITIRKISRLEKMLMKLKMEVDSDGWISEEEAAKVLNVHIATLRRMRREGKISGWRCRSSMRGYQYKRSELSKQFIQGQ